jgi:hypothetical protein
MKKLKQVSPMFSTVSQCSACLPLPIGKGVGWDPITKFFGIPRNSSDKR